MKKMQLEDSQTFCTGDFWSIGILVGVPSNIKYLGKPMKLKDKAQKSRKCQSSLRR